MRGSMCAVFAMLLSASAHAEEALRPLQATANGEPSDLDASSEAQRAEAKGIALSRARSSLRAQVRAAALDAAFVGSPLYQDRVGKNDYLSHEELFWEQFTADNHVMLTLRADADLARMRFDIAKANADHARLAALRAMVCVEGSLESEHRSPVGTEIPTVTLETMLKHDGWQVVPCRPLAPTLPEVPAAEFIFTGKVTINPRQMVRSFLEPELKLRVDTSYELSVVDAAAKKVVATVKSPGLVEIANLWEANAFDYATLRDAVLTLPDRAPKHIISVDNLSAGDADAFVEWLKTFPELSEIARRDANFVFTPKAKLAVIAIAIDGRRFKGRAVSVLKVTEFAIGATLK